MEEILELKQSLLSGNIDEALCIVEELEEVGRKSIIENIESFLVVLLIHLIKNQVEQRLTSSWNEILGGIDYQELKMLVDREKLFNITTSLINLTYIKNQDELILLVSKELEKLI